MQNHNLPCSLKKKYITSIWNIEQKYKIVESIVQVTQQYTLVQYLVTLQYFFYTPAVYGEIYFFLHYI